MKNVFNFLNNKRILLFVFTGFLGFWTQAQEFGLFHTGDKILQSANISPILLNDNKVNFGLLVNVKATNNIGLKLKEILYQNEKNRKINIKWDGFTKNANNRILSDITISVLGVSFKYGKNIFSIHQNFRSVTSIKMNDGFGKILGNGIKETTEDFNINGYSNTYNEIALGYKRRFGKLAVAARLKYLNGLLHYSIKGGGTIRINPDNYIWTISNNANTGLNTAGIDVNKMSEADFTAFTSNHGGAIDIGVSFDVNDKLSLSLSANDIGAIKWNENPKNYILEKVTDTVYKGIDLDKGNMGDIAETVKGLFGYSEDTETTNSFLEMLPINAYLSGTYKLLKNHTISAIVHYQSVLKIPSFSLGYNIKNKKFGAGLHAAYHGVSKDFNIGGSIYMQPGAIQFYLTAENLLDIGQIDNMSKLNFAIGLNIVLPENRRAIKDAIFIEPEPNKN